MSFEHMRTLLTRKCDHEWAQEQKNRAERWVTNGAVTQDVMCKYGWVKDNGCRLSGGAGTEKHRVYPCKEWNQLRLELDHEVRLMEQIVKGDSRCLLWEEELCPSLERVRLRGLFLMRRRLEGSCIGCQKTGMLGIEILEVTRQNCY